MAIAIQPANPDFGGEVTGIDLRQTLTPADVGAIECDSSTMQQVA